MFANFFRSNPTPAAPVSTLRHLANSGRLPLAQYMSLSERLSGYDTTTLRKEIVSAMTRFLYTLEWSNENEERRSEGKKHVRIPGGSNIEDYVPVRTPTRFKKEASELVAKFEEMNGVSVEGLFLLAMAADPGVGLSEAEKFGQDLIYMSNGYGISWFDDHDEFDLKIPRS